jgi:signal peptidase II
MADLRWKAYGAGAALFALDRFTKWLIETRVSFTESHTVIPGFFEIIHSQNSGVAFGMFNDSASPWRTPLLIALQLGALVVVSVMLWNARKMDRFTVCGLACILGGCAGNVFDRALWGQVTDFLLFYIGRYQWPAFNVADMSVVTGCGFLLLDVIHPRRQAANVS